MEDQLQRLQSASRKTRRDQASLLAVVSLLLSALFPALRRVGQLTEQRAILSRQLQRYHKLEEQVAKLVASIRADLGGQDSEASEQVGEQPHGLSSVGPQFLLHPLLRFRRSVVAVLAANRLLSLCKESSFLCPQDPPPPTALPRVELHVSGWGKTVVRGDSRVHRAVRPPPKFGRLELASWLRNEVVLLAVRGGMADLQRSLDAFLSQSTQQQQQQESSGGVEERKAQSHKRKRSDMNCDILAVAVRCFTGFLCTMLVHFPSLETSMGPLLAVTQAATPLCHRLGAGLASVLRTKVPPLAGYSTTDEVCLWTVSAVDTL